MRGSPFFEGVDQVPISARGHHTLTPTFYYDAGFMEATFAARLAALRALLPDPRFVPLRLAPGVGLVVVDCFEYRDSDVGPYDEIAVSIVLASRELGATFAGRQVVALHRRCQGHAFVVHMPVTTESALALGVDFFAFPKFLGDIR